MKHLITTLGNSVSTNALTSAIAISKMNDAQLEQRFGTPTNRRSYSGSGLDGKTHAATWHSSYDRRTRKVIIYDNDNGAISGTPADAENFLGVQVIGTLANNGANVNNGRNTHRS